MASFMCTQSCTPYAEYDCAAANCFVPMLQIGSGVQIICTAVVTVLLATLGFLSPASRGALLTTTIVL